MQAERMAGLLMLGSDGYCVISGDYRVIHSWQTDMTDYELVPDQS